MSKLGIISATSRAADAWRRISDKPTSITLVRDDVAQAAQTVRIEYSVAFKEPSGGAGQLAVGTATVFGINDHATLADTDLQRNDQFLVDDTIYVVQQVVKLPGEVQARCEAVQ